VGAQLTLRNPKEKSEHRAFTHSDNEQHGQLWTPLIKHDQVLIVLDIPKSESQNYELQLTSVNHQFREINNSKISKIGNDTSGSCNVDVVCSASQSGVGPLIDFYRDQIRSVGAYTLQGLDACTGTLINNTAQDNRPFFLTAEHCGITVANAPSVVVFWNFENSTCRIPGSSASGSVADGSLTQFNSGAIFRAANANSDVCLIELDDDVDQSVNPFYAGWDRSGAAPSIAVGIHHPAVAEKRISFELDQTAITDVGGGAGTGFIQVSDWDFGTTEGGSSGSALFDENGNIVGQLFGGNAACGNNASDWYGRFAVSWGFGSSAATRLRDWLDPTNSNVTSLEGINSGVLVSISSQSVAEGDSGQATINLNLTLDSAVSQAVTVDYQTVDGTAQSGSDYVASNGTVTFTPGETSRAISLNINSDTLAEENETFSVNLSNATNAITSPAPGVVTITNDDFILPVINIPASVQILQGALFTYQVDAVNSPTSYALESPFVSGVSINSSTGVVTWTAGAPGTYNFGVRASNPAGATTEIITIEVLSEPILVGIEQSGIAISSSSNQWGIDTNISNDGVDSARSGIITHNQESWFEFDVVGPAVLEFDWRVSSEASFDFLRFLVDNNEVNSISGIVDWETVTLVLPTGTHTIRFNYTKDFSVSTGDDAGWVDNLTITHLIPEICLTRGAPDVLSCSGAPNTTYQIMRSMDLETWSFFTLVTTNGAGVAGDIPVSSSEDRLFYQMVEL